MRKINVRIDQSWLAWLIYIVTAVLFLILKMSGSVTWSWIAVLAPLWGVGTLVGLVAFLVMLKMVALS